LEVVKELALYPTIPPKDLEIERGVILEEINRRDDRPDEMVSEEFQALLFGGNPLGMSILGDPGVIKKVTRQDFLDYHGQHYTAGNLVVALAGKLPTRKVVNTRIDEWFGALPKASATEPVWVSLKQYEPVLRVKNKKLAAQAHIEIGVPGLTVDDPRRYALSLLTAYLGYGLSSRLFLELREKRGLCYAVRADGQRWKDTGVWSVYAGLNIDKLEQAIAAIVAELKRVKEIKLTEAELSQTKEKLRGPMLFSMENPVGQMEYYARQALNKPDDILTYDEVINRMLQIDSVQIQQIARDLLVTEKLNLAVVGPVEKKREPGLVKLLKV
jgi:predicted Zn-dependent peptidase